MNIAVVFSPDFDLGPDPLDTSAKTPRRLGEFIPDGSDVILIWREWGDQFEGGSRTHLISGGIWQNIGLDQLGDVMTAVGSLP